MHRRRGETTASSDDSSNFERFVMSAFRSLSVPVSPAAIMVSDCHVIIVYIYVRI